MRAADGHTILMGNNSILATNAALYKKINFDPESDFAPISLIGSQANILVVNPNVPAKSMAELIALLRANPGKFNYASSGHGAAAHLAAELFKAEAKVEITHVPYKGGAPALQDVIAGHVQMIFATAASVVPHIQSGKVRALAVTPIRRTAVFPELATIDELGLKGFDATTWHGLVAPSKTPREIVVRLHAPPSRRSTMRRCGNRWPISASTSSATRRRSSPPTSRRRSRNGPRS